MLEHVAFWNAKGEKKRTSRKQNVENQIWSKLLSPLFHIIKGEIGDEMGPKIEHIEEKVGYKFDKTGCRGFKTVAMKYNCNEKL